MGWEHDPPGWKASTVCDIIELLASSPAIYTTEYTTEHFIGLRRVAAISYWNHLSRRLVCMKLKIKKIYSKGNYRRECVVLKVLEDCEMGHHLVSELGFPRIAAMKLSDVSRRTGFLNRR